MSEATRSIELGTAVPWIRRGEIESALQIPNLFAPLEAAFKEFSAGLAEAPVAVLRPSEQSDVHLKAATLKGRKIFTVKVAGWSAALRREIGNGSSGMIIAFDSLTCLPKAVLDDQHLISDIRTAATGALAANVCARANIRNVGVVGTGIQAYLQVVALKLVRGFRRVNVWGRCETAMRELTQRLRVALPDVEVCIASLREVVENSDLLITATSSHKPLVFAEWLRPGLHITAVGADDERKCELDPAVLRLANRLIVDSRELAGRYGDVHRALITGAIAPSAITGELGDVFDGHVSGRTSDDEITIAKLVGLGIQDLVTVEHILSLFQI